MNKKKVAGSFAVIAVTGALLAGGSFALWNDTANVTGETITTGNLKLDMDTSSAWKDISAGEASARTISTDTFRLVPGDSLRRTFDITAVLDGDNLSANMVINTSLKDGTPLPSNVSVSYRLKDLSTNTYIRGPFDAGTNTTLTAVSENFAATPPMFSIPLPKTASAPNYQLEVNVVFNSTTSGQQSTTSSFNTGDLAVSLSQTR